MMADFHGWLMMYVAPKVYGEMFVLGLTRLLCRGVLPDGRAIAENPDG